jgi:hypothetical protein
MTLQVGGCQLLERVERAGEHPLTQAVRVVRSADRRV